ncbi:MAG TPA: FtsK/SpoIIIE domain-containing protein [Candidatus Dormibacteraeota bacterium]|nr:FtsK/SpoIIIE domain-containing protein [Candidatus Dormibacteraeota bacterium]
MAREPVGPDTDTADGRAVWLLVEQRGAPPAEVSVRFTPDQRVADLAGALARNVGEGAGDRLALPDGQLLEATALIVDAPIREGDLLRLVDERYRPEVQPVAALELRVVAGPSAGLRFRLPDGVQTLGRGQCDLQIANDPAVSRLHAEVSVREGEAFFDRIQGRNGIRRDGELITAPYHIRPGEVLEAGRSLLSVTAASPAHRVPGRGGSLPFRNHPRPGPIGGTAPDPCDLEDRCRLCLPTLWERRPQDPDFLRLRLGWANWPDRDGDKVRHAAPVTIDLAAHAVLGVTGDEAGRLGLTRWLAVQAAALHRPSDLRIAALLSGRKLEDWGWLKWVPHTASSPGVRQRAIAVRGDPGAPDTDVWSEIADAAAGRAHVLVIAEDGGAEAEVILAEARERGAGGRLHVLWLGDRAPEDASATVWIQPAATGRAHLRVPGRGVDLEDAVPDAIDVAMAARMARDLAGIEEAPAPPRLPVPVARASIAVEPLGVGGVAPGDGVAAEAEAAARPTGGARRTSRELRITVELDGRPCDVVVDVDSDKTIGDLAAALAAHGGLDGGARPERLALRHRRSGRVLAPNQLVHASGLRTGDVLALEPAGNDVAMSRPHPRHVADGVDESGQVPFNRPPRIARRTMASDLRLDPPPQPGPTMGQALRPLLPVGVGLVLGLGMGLATFVITKGQQLTLLLFLLLGPLMGIVSAAFPLADVFSRRRAYREESAEFRNRVAELRTNLSSLVAEEARGLHEAAPAPDALSAWAAALDRRLWERDPEGPDWLVLRVGVTDEPSRLSVELAEGGDPELRSEVDEVVAERARLQGVPLLLGLAQVGTAGLCGTPGSVESLARWLMLQVATLHSPRDVVVAAAVPARERDRWEWLGWLPHVHSDTAPVSGQLVVSDAEPAAASGLLKRLLTLLDERRNAGASPQQTTSVVLLVHEEVRLPPGEVSHLLAAGPAQRIHTIWMGSQRDRLPRECGALLEVDAVGGLTLTVPARGESISGSNSDDVSLEAAAEASRALAPLRDPTVRGAQVGVPRTVGLAELLDLQEDPQRGIQARWERDLAQHGEGRDLSAPIGIAAGHRQFSISVRRDGPHGLVGGMTGSGKSELLQTVVAALAARHSPQALNFLLVDYKGGAAFRDCVDLPHTVGFVTDLDGRLVNRALTSMRAELARRERLQGDAGVKDLEEFERILPDKAPPSLLIIVDEFAALATELPEFVDGMVDIAQRGRSLGIHLVLATQRPAGVIGPKIRANTPLRLSLRFKDESDSEDILKTRDAARPGLPPGRVFTVTSSGELIEFQAGYGGAHGLASPGPAPIRVRDLEFGGVAAAAPGARTASAEVESDLRRLVAVMNEVNRRLDLAPPHRPWLPALPPLLSLSTLPAVQGWRGPTAMIGLLDEPVTQSQTPLSFPLQEEGTLLVYGSSGSGKTTLLRTIAVSAAEAAHPAALNLYALDFATRLLASLDALPHCGGVIMGDEVARAAKLMTWLQKEAERRRALLGAAAAPTLSDYLAAEPAMRLPYILVLVDGYSGFVSALENVDMGAPVDAFKALLTTGRPLGMAFVVTADRAEKGVANLRVYRRLILNASQDDYATFSLPRGLYEHGELEPGRGYTFTSNPKRALEVQCALVGADPAGQAQAAAVAAIGSRLTEQHGRVPVPRIETLPTDLSPDALPAPASSLEAVIGLRENDDDTLGPARVDLGETGHFVISGPAGSGRTNALGAFACSLNAADDPPATHLLTFRRQHALTDQGLWTSVALGEEACRELLARLAAAAREAPSGAEPAVLFLDDGEELVAGMGLPDLDWLVQEGAERGFRAVIAVDAQKELSSRGWMTQVARARHGLVLEPGFGVDGSIAGQPSVKLPQSRTPLPRGRGYLVRDGRYEVIQVARLRLA